MCLFFNIYVVTSNNIPIMKDIQKAEQDVIDIDKNKTSDTINASKKEIHIPELMDTAASEYNVFRPLYVYRRIEHSKRRITMYNSFAG